MESFRLIFRLGQVSVCVHIGLITFQILLFDEFLNAFLESNEETKMKSERNFLSKSKKYFVAPEFTLMCWTFGVNFGVNCDSTSPIRMRLLKTFRIFIMRTMVASIRCRLSSSMRCSVCLFSALRSDSSLLVISKRIFGLCGKEIPNNFFCLL